MDEFLEGDHGEYGLETLADALGATSNCGVCSTTIVDPDGFAARVSEHYGIDPPDDRIRQMVWNSGVETGDFDNSMVCAYHGDVMRRDD